MVLGKLTKEQILKGIQALSEEERQELLNALNGEQEPAEQPAEGQGEAPAVEPGAPQEEPAEPPTEEGSQSNAENLEQQPNTEGVATEQPSTEPALEEPTQEGDKLAEAISLLTDRVGKLEESLNSLSELKSKMEEYTQKQGAQFGLSGRQGNATDKDYKDMSVDELKKVAQQEI